MRQGGSATTYQMDTGRYLRAMAIWAVAMMWQKQQNTFSRCTRSCDRRTDSRHPQGAVASATLEYTATLPSRLHKSARERRTAYGSRTVAIRCSNAACRLIVYTYEATMDCTKNAKRIRLERRTPYYWRVTFDRPPPTSLALRVLRS